MSVCASKNNSLKPCLKGELKIFNLVSVKGLPFQTCNIDQSLSTVSSSQGIPWRIQSSKCCSLCKYQLHLRYLWPALLALLWQICQEMWVKVHSNKSKIHWENSKAHMIVHCQWNGWGNKQFFFSLINSKTNFSVLSYSSNATL